MTDRGDGRKKMRRKEEGVSPYCEQSDSPPHRTEPADEKQPSVFVAHFYLTDRLFGVAPVCECEPPFRLLLLLQTIVVVVVVVMMRRRREDG